MSSKTKVNIFIVEDNKIFMLALKADIESSFMKMPLHIYTFETGEMSMKRFVEIKPHVVILDYHLNSIVRGASDGIKILEWMKNENPETNVIMLSNNDHIDIAVKSFMHGASDYVVKTETKFKKINFSLFNLFQMMVAKSAARRYRNWLILFFTWIALLGVVLIIIKLVNPSLLG